MDRTVSLCSSSDLQASSKTVIRVSHTLRRPELPTCARAYAAAPAGCFVTDASLLCLEGVPYAPSEGMPKTPPSPSPSSAAAAQTFTFPHRRPSPISTRASGGYGRRLLPCPPRFHAARASMRDLLLFIVVRFHFNPIKVLSVLCKRAETCKLESKAFLIYPVILPNLEGTLLEILQYCAQSESTISDKL